MAITVPIFLAFLATCISSGHGKEPSKIWAGEDAPPYSFNFVVSLRVEGKHICGGILIDTSRVLTAASCLLLEKNIVQNNVKVLSGTHDQEDPSTGFLHDVAVIIVHEKFDCANSWNNDLSILKLAMPISVIEGRQTLAHLPLTGDIPVDNWMVAAGWGTVGENPPVLQKFLQRSQMRVISNVECELDHVRTIHPGQFCAEAPTGLTFSNGDGGGPLVSVERDFVAYGVISWSTPALPAVFTRVHYHLAWIEKVRARY